jgi:hypothetical protein
VQNYHLWARFFVDFFGDLVGDAQEDLLWDGGLVAFRFRLDPCSTLQTSDRNQRSTPGHCACVDWDARPSEAWDSWFPEFLSALARLLRASGFCVLMDLGGARCGRLLFGEVVDTTVM